MKSGMLPPCWDCCQLWWRAKCRGGSWVWWAWGGEKDITVGVENEDVEPEQWPPRGSRHWDESIIRFYSFGRQRKKRKATSYFIIHHQCLSFAFLCVPRCSCAFRRTQPISVLFGSIFVIDKYFVILADKGGPSSFTNILLVLNKSTGASDIIWDLDRILSSFKQKPGRFPYRLMIKRRRLGRESRVLGNKEGAYDSEFLFWSMALLKQCQVLECSSHPSAPISADTTPWQTRVREPSMGRFQEEITNKWWSP